MAARGVTVLGAGLAGCEAAWQLARRGLRGDPLRDEAPKVFPRPTTARALPS